MIEACLSLNYLLLLGVRLRLFFQIIRALLSDSVFLLFCPPVLWVLAVLILTILGLVIPNGLFEVCGTYVLIVDETFFMLSLRSILLSGDRGLRSMFRFIVGLFLWSRSLMLVILIDDLLSDFLFDSCIYCWRPLFSLYP